MVQPKLTLIYQTVTKVKYGKFIVEFSDLFRQYGIIGRVLLDL